ncbi:hypothetical protein J2794_003605 [Paraburkholderia terricola]|uniref:tail fiber domain-containing protein n=1 Tax=Paraburkholderia terricola TaxID=169427 RepID=UPI002864B2FA|nr:tail fiber domain-containing protein [Paraburkholderia terricola]MDR6447489.1 hypothetical protein [Paraburkholderia terricola]
MSSLAKVLLGTAPLGTDGDPVRTAFMKANSNVDVLNAQAALTSAGAPITAAQALTAAAHLGKRVNIALAAAGTINLPAASTCAADSVILLRNTGTTVVTLAITASSGDTVALSKLNAGESALMDTDGVHAWTVLMRGRTNSDNEVVNGNCTVNGNETVAGTLGVTGAATFTLRPTFAAKTPWDSGNLPSPASTASPAFTGSPSLALGARLAIASTSTTYTAFLGSDPSGFVGFINQANNAWNMQLFDSGALVMRGTVSATFAPGGSVGQCNYNANGLGSLANIGFASNNSNASLILRCSASSVLEVINGASNAYNAITCSSVTQTSDRDLKTDIAAVRAVLPLLRNKRVVNYRFKVPVSEGGGASRLQIGVVAQEWQEDFPELVEETEAEIDADGDFIAHQYDPETGEEIYGPNGKPASRKALGFNYSNASAVALQGVIELQRALTAALDRIAALEVTGK